MAQDIHIEANVVVRSGRGLPLGGIGIHRDLVSKERWIEMVEDGIETRIAIPKDEGDEGANVVSLRCMTVQMSIRDQPDDLCEFIERWTPELSDQQPALNSRYRELGDSIRQRIARYVNRLIAWLRSEKGQYWLELLEWEDENGKCNFLRDDKIRVGDGDWIDGISPRIIRHSRPEEFYARFLDVSDWENLSSSVQSRGRTDLVLELLAAAERFLVLGERRVALTEAITAMEIAISEFCRGANATMLFDGQLGPRLGVESLTSLFKQIGKTGILAYVLPIILPPQVLSSELLKKCRDANNARNNLVHSKQHDVRREMAFLWIPAIREFCTILRANQESRESEPCSE